MTAEQIIDRFKMVPLEPEGGFISVSYTSGILIPKEALPARYSEPKALCGAILYLITPERGSRMHRLPTDELYHFYLGDPVEQLRLFEDGTGRIVRLGPDILRGQEVQSLAPANCWQGTRLAEGGKFALLGTTMAPAWTEGDYEDGLRAELAARYPEFEEEIIRRT
ncbi:MAG: cupin domain-containing protein [Spirochaetales bacterium]|jgi:predicted cupin superfamily sugar epimerase|nr:cupin domain-containing protein [Spirochaetales bacterium]